MKYNREARTIRVNRDGKPLRFPERFLLAFCRPVNAPALPVATYGYTLENSLDFGKRMIPNFPACLHGKTVLDFGCGHGFQAVGMARAGAKHVHGVDIIPEFLNAGRSLAEKANVSNVSFSAEADPRGYDVVISLGAMEHFGDPAAILRRMLALARERVVISFAEPWFSPYGTHLNGTTRLPWLNLIFSEKTLINVRNLYPDGVDGATCFAEISGGLNKMTVHRFEKLVSSIPGVEVETLKLTGVKNLGFATRVPLIRELMTSAITCVLRTTSARASTGTS